MELSLLVICINQYTITLTSHTHTHTYKIYTKYLITLKRKEYIKLFFCICL